MLIVNCMLVGISSNGMELIRQIMTIYNHYDFKTLVLVASARHPQHMVEAALAGGHTLYDAVFNFPTTGQTSTHRSRSENVSRGLEPSTPKSPTTSGGRAHPGPAGESRWGLLTLADHEHSRRGHMLEMTAHLALYQKTEFNAT